MEGQHWQISKTQQLPSLHRAIEKALDENGTLVVQIWDGRKRSDGQNKLQHAMYREIGKQLYGGDWRLAKRECKLTIGVPILRQESEQFKDLYDKVIGTGKNAKIDHQTKLEFMEVLDVSSALSVSGANEYIEGIYSTYAEKFSWSDFVSRSKKELTRQ